MKSKRRSESLFFIDANIYLRFYDTKSEAFKKLLKSIIEIKARVFVTDQIVKEVVRNRLKVFMASSKTYLNQFKFTPALLPEHLSVGADLRIQDWNKETGLVEESIKKQKEKLVQILDELAQDILIGSDGVSTSLIQVFEMAKLPSAAQLADARLRKETGNPPGKKDDPLGDQISWEQLLNNLSPWDELYIVTNDGDFITEINKKLVINPLLLGELQTRNPQIKVKCFTSLAEALGDFNKSEKIDSLPFQDQLNSIAKQEKELRDSVANLEEIAKANSKRAYDEVVNNAPEGSHARAEYYLKVLVETLGDLFRDEVSHMKIAIPNNPISSTTQGGENESA